MLNFLFRGLTADTARGARLFDVVTAETRRPHWYVEGAVPDTLDGRFAVLATVAALVLVRLERDGPKGNEASVALTERFIADGKAFRWCGRRLVHVRGDAPTPRGHPAPGLTFTEAS